MSLTIQFQTMLAMIGMGLYVGAALDTYGRFVKRRNVFHLLTAVNDILFWLVQGLFVFYVLFIVNNGELRVYIFLALLCGYAAYQSLFRKIYIRLLEWFISFIVSCFRLIRNIFLTIFVRPVKTILKLLFTLCMMIVTSLVTVVLFILKLLWRPIRFLLVKVSKLLKLDIGLKKVSHSRLVQTTKEIFRWLTSWRRKEDDE